MSYFAERRKYQRCDCLVCKILMSVDGTIWESVDLNDISAGGMNFSYEGTFEENTNIRFDLYVYNMLSEFNIVLEGRIIRIDKSKEKCYYAVRFENMDKYQQVQLDELIKSKVTVRNTHEYIIHEEDYSTHLFPKYRQRPRKIRIQNYK